MGLVLFFIFVTIIVSILAILFTGKKETHENKKNKIKTQRTISKWIFAIPIIMFIIASIIKDAYRKTNEPTKQITQIAQGAEPTQQINKNQEPQVIYRAPTQEEEKAYMKEHNLFKLGSEYHWYGIKENGEVKPITNALEMNCQDDFCKIQNYFDYVKKIPYEAGIPNQDKNAMDVLMQEKGDCDERSHLLASLMLQGGYETIFIYTDGHAFAGLNIPNYETNERKSYIQYNNKKYYYAETTNINAYIGMYNGIDTKKFKFIYSVNEKRIIQPNEIQSIQIYL